MFKNNLKLGYIFFVGLPLLVLIGTLRSGANLTAPPAVSGEWAIERTPAQSGRPLVLTISQTGADLLITFDDPRQTAITGTLTGRHIAAGGAPGMRLEAEVTGMPGRRSLSGQLQLGGCGTCAPFPFLATKSSK